MFEIPQATRNFGVCRILDEEWDSILKNSEGDITFRLQNKTEIQCKSSLLTLNSTYFKHMLSKDFSNKNSTVFEVKSWNDQVFKVMIKFF